MARSTTNKQKTKAKKTAPKAGPRPRAQINARAKLVNIRSAAGEKSGYGSSQQQETCVELTLRVSMGTPARVPSWADFKGQSWNRSDFIRRELGKLKPPKPAKAKKGETAAVPIAETVGAAIDEAAEAKRLGAHYDADQRVKYDRACEKANASNLQFMERAAAFAMFMALRGQDVQLALSPVQQGFKEMFSGQQPQLGSGQPDDASDDDPEDLYGDDNE